MITNPDLSIPMVVVMLYPSCWREVACLVLYRDAAFGNQLLILRHPTLNDAHPPLVARLFPLVECWQHKDRHWHVQLPLMQEQTTKGMFSRSLSTCCQCAREALLSPREPGHEARAVCYLF